MIQGGDDLIFAILIPGHYVSRLAGAAKVILVQINVHH